MCLHHVDADQVICLCAAVQAYLASESEDSEPDEAAQAKYRALLAGDGGDSRKGGKGWGAAAAHDSEVSEVPSCIHIVAKTACLSCFMTGVCHSHDA